MDIISKHDILWKIIVNANYNYNHNHLVLDVLQYPAWSTIVSVVGHANAATLQGQGQTRVMINPFSTMVQGQKNEDDFHSLSILSKSKAYINVNCDLSITPPLTTSTTICKLQVWIFYISINQKMVVDNNHSHPLQM